MAAVRAFRADVRPAQDSQAFNGTVFGFRDRRGPAVEYRLSGLVGVQRVGFAL